MSFGRIRRVREIFEAALAQDPQERTHYLTHVCGEDADLYKEVVTLLNAHEQGRQFFDRPALAQFAPSLEGDDLVPLHAGSVIGERFEIQGLLGRGGMGEVYQAHDTKLQRKVALKFLVPVGAADPLFRRLLQREARTLAALRHPHICTVFDVCSHDDRDFVVMEYLEGETLAARLRRGGALSMGELVEIARQVCDALQFAHGRGILHRDLKPANIMLTADGAKLLDFGIATFTSVPSVGIAEETLSEQGAAPATLTLAGRGAGTVQYMSPEQALGQPLDRRSDVFSFGVVMYEMATGSAPFCGATVGQVLNAILNEQPAPVRRINSGVPVYLELIIAKCLEKTLERRYASAVTLGEALRPMSEHSETRAADFGSGTKVTRAWSLAALISLLVATVVYREIDLRSALTLECTRTEAIRVARQAAAELGYSLEGLTERIAFNPAVDLERFLVQHGISATREMVGSGRGFAWEVDFTSNGNPGFDEAGISMRIDTSGRLLEFRSKRKAVASNPASQEALKKKATEAVLHHLGLNTVSTPLRSVFSFSQGAIELTWAIPVSVWEEEVQAAIAGGQIYLLNRRVVTAYSTTTPDNSKLARVAEPASVVQRVNQAQLILALYGYGIWIFVKRRRFLSLPWRVPVLLTLSGVAGLVWFMYSSPSANTSNLSGWRMLDSALTIIALLLPAMFGLYAALRQNDRARVLTLEKLLSADFRNLAVTTEIKNGVLAGGVLAGIYMIRGAAIQAGVHLPDTEYLMMGILGDAPWRFGDVGTALMTALITMAVVTTYTVLKRLTRREWFAIILSALILAFWDVDIGSPRATTDLVFGVAAICCQLMIYRTSGLTAALCANLSSRLIVAGLVGVHLENRRFAEGSLVMLAIPAVLLYAPIVVGYVLRVHQTGPETA